MKSKEMKDQNRKRDIIFLLTQDLESPSGLGRYFPLAKNLVKQGLSVTIAALHSNINSLDNHNIDKEGVKVAYVSQMHVKKMSSKTEYFGFFQLFWVSLKATWRLFSTLIKNPAKVVVIGKPHPMNSIAGLIGGFLIDAKIILDCDDYEAKSNYFESTWQRWVIKIFENWMPKLVHQITTNTIFNQERMVQLGIQKDKIEYLPNGVDRERFQFIDKTKTNQIIKTLNINNYHVIVYIGSLNLDNHPVDLLMYAFKIITENVSNIKLLIVGGGKDFKSLNELAKKLNIHSNVIFVGRVSQDLVPHYYQMADISVDPVNNTDTAKGRCPLKMFESWAMNIPFVTADVGDRNFLAGQSQTILLAEPGNPDDLALKIITILGDQQLAANLRNSGKKRVENFFWCNLVNDHLHIFTKPKVS